MATATVKWTQVTISEPTGMFGYSRDVKLRTVKTGRGKAAVERWQRYVSIEMDFDGSTPEDAIKRIQEASEGVEDARFDIDYWSESRTLSLIGWTDETSEERIALGRAQIAADTAKKQEAAEDKAAAEKAQLLALAAKYPELVK